MHASPIQNTDYKAVLARYRQPCASRAGWQLVNTVVPLFVLWFAMWWGLRADYPIVLLLALPASGFLVRAFMLQHDCGHGCFFPARWANQLTGYGLSLLLMTPYLGWRRKHIQHHASSGNLEHRGHGDINTLTVEEYRQLPAYKRIGYRIYRHPIFLLLIAPMLHFAVLQRFRFSFPHAWSAERRNILLTNIMLVAVFAGLWWLIGVEEAALIYLPTAWLGAGLGVYLFHVQHQFPDTYWQKDDTWDFAGAGLQGSSHFVMPKVLQWFTANIGLHHIHHLDSNIPNYRLQQCQDENPQLRAANEVTLLQSLSTVWLALWDEQRQELIRFDQMEDQAV